MICKIFSGLFLFAVVTITRLGGLPAGGHCFLALGEFSRAFERKSMGMIAKSGQNQPSACWSALWQLTLCLVFSCSQHVGACEPPKLRRFSASHAVRSKNDFSKHCIATERRDPQTSDGVGENVVVQHESDHHESGQGMRFYLAALFFPGVRATNRSNASRLSKKTPPIPLEHSSSMAQKVKWFAQYVRTHFVIMRFFDQPDSSLNNFKE